MIKSKELEDPTSCLNKAADDEPIFVLRANDPLAPGVVDYWYTQAVRKKLHTEKLEEAFNIVGAMHVWYNRKERSKRES